MLLAALKPTLPGARRQLHLRKLALDHLGGAVARGVVDDVDVISRSRRVVAQRWQAVAQQPLAAVGDDHDVQPLGHRASGRSTLEHQPEERFVRSLCGLLEDLRRRALLDDDALVHEDDAGRRRRGRSPSRG